MRRNRLKPLNSLNLEPCLAIRSAYFNLTVAYPDLQYRLRVHRWTFEHPPIFQ